MADPMMVLGKLTICMAMVFINGKMEGNMRDTTSLIRSMVTESISGLMAESTKATGQMASNMDRANMSFQMGL
jgi:hypothetical protein